MTFNPKTEYDIQRTNIRIRDFDDYADDYETRPPYQRRVVWDRKKQQALLDSLFRRFYIPSIVLRIVRLDEAQAKYEVVDGQQRINTVQAFFRDELPLPHTLADISSSLSDSTYSALPSEIKKFIHKELKFDVDIIKNISDPFDPTHQKAATEIFWRLQQGESLNNMETAHARLSSLIRNFLVKYADDYDFDFDKYITIDRNPHKLAFFTETRARTNSRMQHLTLLGRFLLIEIADGATDLGDRSIVSLIDREDLQDRIGSQNYEDEVPAKAVVRNLKLFHKVFHDDELLDIKGSGILALRYEYFTISCYMLLRHLRKYYVYNDEVRLCFRDFVWDFYRRIQGIKRTTNLVNQFVESRQQNVVAVSTRDRIFRLEFFKSARENDRIILVEKDRQRAFNEDQRIEIYLRDNGFCQQCLSDGLPENESRVPWTEFHGDHIIPWIKGGETKPWNGQVLCRTHNQQKGANYDH
ncbi:MAG: DUF262 domain-containing protein [Chloroflexi bacterium]|nr:DUF262 domain-containing protein [Chloroflexota bacterium]MCY4248457.1 DUF262 domain-containing protein [Chloroflexota bacterium]